MERSCATKEIIRTFDVGATRAGAAEDYAWVTITWTPTAVSGAGKAELEPYVSFVVSPYITVQQYLTEVIVL